MTEKGARARLLIKTCRKVERSDAVSTLQAFPNRRNDARLGGSVANALSSQAGRLVT
jgi:hypothetical protein